MMNRHKSSIATHVAVVAVALGACSDISSVATSTATPDPVRKPAAEQRHEAGAVYLQTNSAKVNRVVVFHRAADGTLRRGHAFRTGGRGTGMPRLGSQNSVLLSRDRKWLFVANAGSSEISVFAVRDADRAGQRDGEDDARRGDCDDDRDGVLSLVDKVPSGGQMPLSLTLREHLLYVVNAGGEVPGGSDDNITAFTLHSDGRLAHFSGSTRSLSAPNTMPAEIAFSPDGGTLVVTERATDRIDTYRVDHNGLASGPTVHASSGVGPFGFAFRHDGVFVVTESFNGAVGQAAASSYLLSGGSSVGLITGTLRDTQSDVCWALFSANERYAYITNNGSGTISSYRVAPNGSISLLAAVAAVTGSPGGFGARDEALSDDGRYLYAIDVGTQRVNAFAVNADGGLTKLGEFGELPPTLAGLAAR